MNKEAQRRDVVVIGAGQAGLAIGRLLVEAGMDFLILDAGGRIGYTWRKRYRGLTLFTPRRYSALAGVELPGEPDGYPSKDEFADYLEGFAAHFRLPVTCRALVTSVARDGAGLFRIAGEGFDPIHARAVIIASGGFRTPVVPHWGAHLFDIPSVAAEAFGTRTLPPDGPLLIVGDGASGRDIAMLEAQSRQVVLANGRRRRLLPERILGRSLWWWLDKTGLLRAKPESRLGRYMRRIDPFPDRNRSLRALRAAGVDVRGRATDFASGHVTFEDGSTFASKGVVWALGLRPDWSFLDVWDAFDHRGNLSHENGVSCVPGLYFLGLPWQRNRASALVMGVSEDAAFLAAALMRFLDRKDAEIPPASKSSSDRT